VLFVVILLSEKILILSLTIFAGCLFFSCQPALGSSWYKRSVKDGEDKKMLTVQLITVCGVTLYPEANGEDFIGKVNAKDSILYPDDISAAVKDNTGTPVGVSVTIKGSGGQAALKEGEPVTVPIILKTVDGSNLEIQKYLFLEQDGSMGRFPTSLRSRTRIGYISQRTSPYVQRKHLSDFTTRIFVWTMRYIRS